MPYFFNFSTIFWVIIAGAAAELATDDNDLVTDPLTDSSANAIALSSYNTLLQPSLVDKSSSSYVLVPPDLAANGDIFINASDDPGIDEGLDLSDEGVESGILASIGISSVPSEACSVVHPPVRSRRRRRRRRKEVQPLECTAAGSEDESKPYFGDFHELASQSGQKISNFDANNCLGVLPYFICSSKDPFNTVYWPSILSWMLYESSRGMLHR